MTKEKQMMRPWVLRQHDSDYSHPEGAEPIEIVDAYGEVVACNSAYYPTAIEAHHAAHIVKCVNMHDELVEALKNVDKAVSKGNFIAIRDLARETLKKAGAL